MVNMHRKMLTRVFICTIIGMFLFLGIFLYLLSCNSSYRTPNIKISAPLIDKVRESQKSGSTIGLNSEELNELIGMYFKKEKIFRSIIVKGINAEVLKGNVKFYIPVTYKGYNFLLTSEGGLGYKNEKIEYICSYIKIGKVSLPKAFILNKLQSHLGKTVSIENNNILIDKKIIPLDIKSLNIKDNKILIDVQKPSGTLEEKLKSIQNKGKEIINNNTESNSKAKNDSEASNSVSTEGNSSKSPVKVKNTSEMDAALDRISGGLSSAMGSCNTGGQKAVISEMISAANSMKGNPNANPYGYASGARASYNSLSPQEKAELKAAVFSNINGNDVNIVSKMLGK